MNVSPEITDRLKSIDWFSRCEVDEPVETNINAEQVASWQEAQSCFSDASWEDIGGDAQGVLTEHLSSRFPDKYQGRWNTIVKEARNVVNDVVMPTAQRFQTEKELTGPFSDCVQWDVLHAVMTMVYAECSPPNFFLDILKIYESGHYPCGWNGDWPSGSVKYI